MSLFDKDDCKKVSNKEIEITKKLFRAKLNGMWGSIAIFPIIGVIFLLIASIMKFPGLEKYPYLGIIQVLCLCFFSYIMWSGNEDLRNTFRKRISLARNAELNLMKIESLINHKQPYIFYLRDYKTGEGIHTISDVKMPSFVGGYTTVKREGSLRMEKVTQYLEEIYPIVMLYNSRDKTSKYKGMVLFCSDDQWFNNFKILARNATIVVLDYAENFYESLPILSEIKFLVDNQIETLAVGTKEELNRLRCFGINLKDDSQIIVEGFRNEDSFVTMRHSSVKILIRESIKEKIIKIERKRKKIQSY